MAFTEWSMRGTEVANCNCDCGCPCQFNRLPTHGRCMAYLAMQIDKGLFGDVPLDGLRWGVVYAWPGPVHLGQGTLQAFIDDRANAQQRTALETIAHGKETDPGSLMWQVFASMTSTFLPTLFAPVEITVDVDNRKAAVRVPGVIDGSIGPIINPVTGKAHRARVTLPMGFEFTEAEFAAGTATVKGGIPLDFKDTHAHLAHVHWSTHGVVR